MREKPVRRPSERMRRDWDFVAREEIYEISDRVSFVLDSF